VALAGTGENIVQSALAAGAGLAEPKPQSLPGGRIGYIIPEGCRLHEIEPVNAELPDHVIASPGFEDTASFIKYVNRFKGKETAIFASLKKNTMQAVIDYHAGGGKVSRPDRCRHTAAHDFHSRCRGSAGARSTASLWARLNSAFSWKR